MTKGTHDMTLAGTAARLRASIAWLREGTPTQNGGIGVADMEAMLPIIDRAASAARTCAVCGRPPHPIDDPQCMPATKPVAEQLAWALREIEVLRPNRPVDVRLAMRKAAHAFTDIWGNNQDRVAKSPDEWFSIGVEWALTGGPEFTTLPAGAEGPKHG